MGRREHSFLSTLKPQIFIPPKFEGMGGNEIKFNELKLRKYLYIFNLLF